MDKRNIIQIITTIIYNLNISGFFTKKIYKGDLKKVCVPGFNCYACPGAVMSCPIGALQSVSNGRKYNISLYALGSIVLVGIIFGRIICGFACPFGMLQDFLYKIPTKKFKIPKKIHSKLIYLKYFMLFGVVLLAGAIFSNKYGIGKPYFCEFFCPIGTLEGGIPLTLGVESLRRSIGILFGWKMFLLIGTVVASIYTYRPFCKYICPLGAAYGLLNPVSFYKYKVDKEKCTSCRDCVRACKMNVEMYKKSNSPECIRCGDCVGSCKVNAITKGFTNNTEKNK